VPEGDSLHRIAARLQPLVGERVEASSPSPRGLVTNVARAVDGRVLESVEAVGKHLLLRFDGGVTVRSHLRMNGRWTVRRREGVAPWRGRPWLILRTTEWEAAQWNGPVLRLDDGRTRRLGPDLLADETTVDEVVGGVRSSGRERLLGEALLDQRIVSGIGNMWLAELLWHAQLSPWLPVGNATDEELARGIGWARDAMRASIAGSRAARTRAVYRRAGRPCRRCGTPIRSRGLGEMNRTAYWCERCQRGA
jgi:endonuclease-8